MRLFKIIFWIFYRFWFYIVMGVPIIIMFPLLFVSVLKESWYLYFFKLARIWAKVILFCMGFPYRLETEQVPELGKSYMFIANHTSMVDIMLMLAIIKNPFVFVGKKELVKIPIFGYFYKRTCILVDRDNPKSRLAVYDMAQKRINQGLSVCIFPEGVVPDDESIIITEFKNGAFNLAIDHKLPIVPITFPDNKKRFSYTFFSGSPGLMRAKIHHFIETKDKVHKDKKNLNEQSRLVIYNQLLAYNAVK